MGKAISNAIEVSARLSGSASSSPKSVALVFNLILKVEFVVVRLVVKPLFAIRIMSRITSKN